MSKKSEVLGIRTDLKLRHYVEEAEISKTDLLRLGTDVYYEQNPHLKIKAKKKWIQKNLVNLKNQELSTQDEIDSLERDLFNLTLSTQKVKDFFSKNNFECKEEFLKSVFEIKKVMGSEGTLADVPNSDFGIQSLCCNMETEEFKSKIHDFFELYEEVES